MCTLVWMKITQNRPDQNIILFYSLFFEHSMHIFQIVCSRQSELLKNGMCNTRVVLTEGFFTVHSIYDERGSEVAKWPSWSDQVIVLSQNHMLPSNFSVTTMRKMYCRRIHWTLWVQSNDSNCKSFVKVGSTSRAQGIHTKVRALSLHFWQHYLCMINYRILQSQGCIFANSYNISMQISQYKCKKWVESFTNPYLGSKQCSKNKVFLFLKLKLIFNAVVDKIIGTWMNSTLKIWRTDGKQKSPRSSFK